MIAGFHSHFCIGKYLVNVSVKDDIVESTRGIHKAVPVCLNVLKCVVDDNRCIAVLGPNVSKSIVVELLQCVHIDAPICWLIQELNRCYNIGITSVTVGKVLDRGQGLGCGIALLPLYGSIPSAVIKTILG